MPIRKEGSRAKKILFTSLVLFVLVSSILGFTLSSLPFGTQQGSEKMEYNGVELFQAGDGIAAKVGGQLVRFTYFPSELEGFDAGNISGTLKSSRMAYATSDPDSVIASAISGAEFDINRVLAAGHSSLVSPAFTKENAFNKSVITCSDATAFVPVLFFNFTNSTTEISGKGNCITINVASESALNKVRDRVLYELIGAMK